MQRNSSFFWASDDLRTHVHQDGGGDSSDDYGSSNINGDDDDDGDNHDRLLLNSSSSGIGISLSIEEEISDEELDVLPERIALNQNLSGYGTSTSTTSAAAAAADANTSSNGNDDGSFQSSIAAIVVDPTTGRRRLFDQQPQRMLLPLNDLSPQRRNSAHNTTTMIANTNNRSIIKKKTIRFQVVIWHIGTIDVQTGHVKMRFRLTLFWNDDNTTNTGRESSNKVQTDSLDDVWVMQGRQRAYRKQMNINQQESTVKEMIDVPPVSILNAVEFEIVGDAPDVTMIDSSTRAMRWTCMYNATLFQGDHMSVKDFPHDRHQMKLKLGILANRGKGGRWDHNVHRLGLAGMEDSQGSTRVPHGLVIDHCRVPDFCFDPSDLRFQFIPLMFGGGGGGGGGVGKKVEEKSPSTSLTHPTWENNNRDVFLQVTLPVYRHSGHYDSSILPMLVMLNIIAITCLTRNFASATAATEIMLSIAFVQVGIRLTLDSRLPSVGYQIKMQKVMNCCFWLLSGLVLESNTVFFLVKKRGWEIADTDMIDLMTAGVALVYNVYIIVIYFHGKGFIPLDGQI
ncbi:hypothetical protein ACHAXR_003405 [Thalassiosira sp. AJA248-18]